MRRYEPAGVPIPHPHNDSLWLVPFYVHWHNENRDCLYRLYEMTKGVTWIKNCTGKDLEKRAFGNPIRVDSVTKKPLKAPWIEGPIKPKKKQTLIQIDDVEWGDWIDPFMVLVEERK